MKTTKEIIGLPIVSIFDGTEIGTVKNIIINADDRSINFVVVDAGLHLLGAKVISTDRILGIGEYAVTVEDENVVSMISKIPAAIDLLEKNVQIKGSKVLTKKGRLAGEISEIFVDEEDGCHILGMAFIPLGGNGSPVFLPDKCVITYGKHLVIVFEAFDAMLTGIDTAGKQNFGGMSETGGNARGQTDETPVLPAAQAAAVPAAWEQAAPILPPAQIVKEYDSAQVQPITEEKFTLEQIVTEYEPALEQSVTEDQPVPVAPQVQSEVVQSAPAEVAEVAPPEVAAASVFAEDTAAAVEDTVEAPVVSAEQSDQAEDLAVQPIVLAVQAEVLPDQAEVLPDQVEIQPDLEALPVPAEQPDQSEELTAQPMVLAAQPMVLAAQPMVLAAQPMNLAAQAELPPAQQAEPIETDTDTVIEFPVPTVQADDLDAQPEILPEQAEPPVAAAAVVELPPASEAETAADAGADVLELADASETVTAAGDELGQESTTLLGETETISEPAVDIESEAGLFEERQRQYLLGRTITRNILDNGGGVIAEAGTAITYEIIARAKAEGKMVQLVMNNRA